MPDSSSSARERPARLAQRNERAQADCVPAQRLIVVVPNWGVDAVTLARRVWALASPCQLQVLFLTLVEQDSPDESRARLRLSTLASMARDDQVQTDSAIRYGHDWIATVSELWQPGDLVICLVEQTVPVRGFGRQPLCQVLDRALDVPVYVLSGLCVGEPEPARAGKWKFAYWIVPLVIFALFALVQIRFDQISTGWLHTALIGGSAVLEVGLIGVWSLLR
jgi:hypothetical protein